MAPAYSGVRVLASITLGSIFLAGLLVAADDEPCFADAIPFSERSNITVDGVSMPVGVVHLDWDSARQASQVYTILAEEILGYHVFPTAGLASITALYMTMGCANPTDVEDPQCNDAIPGSSDPRTHVVLEIWHGGNTYELQRMTENYPLIAPVKVGQIGYTGMEEMFILEAPREEAMRSDGLALEYYRSYNVSWYQAWQYFPLRVSAVDTSRLKLCTDASYMNEDSHWSHYLRYTGDTDGVIIDSDGRHRARCWNDYFFFSPACRDNPETCILFITGGGGWGLDAYCQKAAKFDMPMAFATAANYDEYLILPRDYGTPLYWWTPDINFVDLSPSRIIFPDYSPAAWLEGDKTSASQNIELSKWVFNGLENVAPRLMSLAQSFTLELSQMDEMLVDKGASGDSYRAVACRWLRANQALWESWIPDETTCNAGMGLINASDSYVQDRSLAASCEPCMPGRFSQVLVDDVGKTHACLPCSPGSFQVEPLQESCEPCPPGTLSDEWGQEECEACPKMHFQPSDNSTSCERCPAPMTTEVLGATSESSCICPEGHYKPLTPSGGSACEDCPVGMSCAEGSDEANLPRSAAAVSDAAYPRLDRGYYAEFASPLFVYRCRDEAACPGIESETCAANMEGIACGRCKYGYYRLGDGCAPCNDVEESQMLFPILPILLGPPAVFGLHRVSRDPFELWGSPQNALQAAMYVILVYMQMLASIVTCYISFPATFGNTVGWSERTYDLMSSLRPECAVLEDFAIGFAVKLFLPAYAAVLFVMTYGASKVLELWKPALHLDRDVVFNNFMSAFYTFFVGIAAQTISLWQCYEHPNGKRSLMSAPDVLCYESDWEGLVAVSVIAALLFCVGSLVVFSWATVVAPRRFHEETFRKRWKFLFIKFRPDVYWWGIVLLTRGIWIPLATVAFDVGSRQMIWLGSMALAYLLGCFAFLPWRSFTVAALDVIVHACLLFLFTLLPHFATPGEVSEEELARSASAIAFLPLCFGAFGVVYMLCLVSRVRCAGRFRTVSEKAAEVEQLCKVFSQLSDPVELMKVWHLIPTTNRLELMSAKNTIVSEVLRQHCDRRLSVRGPTSASHEEGPAEGAAPFTKAGSTSFDLSSDQAELEPMDLPTTYSSITEVTETSLAMNATDTTSMLPPQPPVEEPPASAAVNPAVVDDAPGPVGEGDSDLGDMPDEAFSRPLTSPSYRGAIPGRHGS